MTPALLLDEMLGPRIAEGLRAKGLDAVAIAERAELRSLPDDAVLAAATLERRAVVTFNVADFVRLDHQWKAEGRAHAGLVLLTRRAFPQDRSLVGAVVSSLAAAAEAGQLPGEDAVLHLRRA